MLGSFPTLKHGIRRFVKTFDTVGNKAVFFFCYSVQGAKKLKMTAL